MRAEALGQLGRRRLLRTDPQRQPQAAVEQVGGEQGAGSAGQRTWRREAAQSSSQATTPPPRRRGRPGTWSRCAAPAPPRAGRAVGGRGWRRCCRRAPGRRRGGHHGLEVDQVAGQVRQRLHHDEPGVGAYGGRDLVLVLAPGHRAGRWRGRGRSRRTAGGRDVGRPRWVLAIRQALSAAIPDERHRVRGHSSSASADSNQATPNAQALVDRRLPWLQRAAEREVLVGVAAGLDRGERVRGRQVDRGHVRPGGGEAVHPGVHGGGLEVAEALAHGLRATPSAPAARHPGPACVERAYARSICE